MRSSSRHRASRHRASILRQSAIVLALATGTVAEGCGESTPADPTSSDTPDAALDVVLDLSRADSTSSPELDASADHDALVVPNDSGADSADGAEPDADASLDQDAGLTVTGRAMHIWLDAPVAGATVTIAGVQQTTAADGTFTFTGVSAPYDVTVTYTTNGVAMMDVFRGLTTVTPTLESGGSNRTTPNSVTISGSLTGITSPVPADQRVRVFGPSTGGGIAVQNIAPGQNTQFYISPQWFGASTRNIKVRALVLSPSTQAAYPTSFVAYGETTVSATSGQPLTNVTIAMAAPATKQLTGTITPANYSGSLYSYIRFGAWGTNDSTSESWEVPAVSPFSLTVPDLPGASFGVGMYRTYPNGGKGGDEIFDPINQTYALVEPAGEPVLTAPAANATFTPGMTFSWDAPPGANGTYRFMLSRAGGIGPVFQETTTGTSVTVPLGFVPSAGVAHNWTVAYYPASPDKLAGPIGFHVVERIRVSRSMLVP